MSEGIYRIFDSIWRLSLVGSYCILLVILARILLKKSAEMVLLSVVGNRVRAVVLSGAAGDQDQPDSRETADSGDTDESCDGGRYAGGRRMG